MPRPKTLGPPITFRLPLNAHHVIAERAEANGETINDYVKRQVERLVASYRPGPILGRPATIYDRGKVEPRWKKSMKQDP